MNAVSTSPINPAHLQLGAPEKLSTVSPDGSARYKVPLRYKGNRIVLQTPPLTMSSLAYKGNSVRVPQPRGLRQQLAVLNDFARTCTSLPWEFQNPNVATDSLFKPTYGGETLYIYLATDCIITKLVNGVVQQHISSAKPEFGLGRYTFVIEAPHVFIGRYKQGQLYSLNLEVGHIHYDPEPLPSILMRITPARGLTPQGPPPPQGPPQGPPPPQGLSSQRPQDPPPSSSDETFNDPDVVVTKVRRARSKPTNRKD